MHLRLLLYNKHEIRTEKCSDIKIICQHIFLTFAMNDLTLVEICTVVLYIDSDVCHSQPQECLEIMLWYNQYNQ